MVRVQVDSGLPIVILNHYFFIFTHLFGDLRYQLGEYCHRKGITINLFKTSFENFVFTRIDILTLLLFKC